MQYFNWADFTHSLPLLFLLIVGLALMLADAFKARTALPAMAMGGLLLSAIMSIPEDGLLSMAHYGLYYNNMIAFGGVASLIHLFLCLSGFFSLFFFQDYLKRWHKEEQSDVYALVVFSVIGMIMLANANDLVVVFVGLEVMSVCLYIMAGVFPRDPRSNEAGLKYFLLGAFATGFLLYGIALLYGLTGMAGAPTTQLDRIAGLIDQIQHNPLFYVAFGLILVGFLFKVAAFPFHSWTPDVYTGAPTPMAGFMATGSKMAAFTAFGFFMMKAMPMTDPKIINLLGFLAIASMLYGNIVAVQQRNVKRILAYSSIAHTGYLLLGICAGPVGYMSVIYYMFIYSIMTIGAFGVISIVENHVEDCDLKSWKGLGIKYPWLGAMMAIFLFSLSGMPPLAGFMGKYFVFGSAVSQELYVWVTIGILTSVIGAFYYLRIIWFMFFEKPDGEDIVLKFNAPTLPMAGVYILAALLIIFGMFPSIVSSYLDALYSGAGFMTAAR